MSWIQDNICGGCTSSEPQMAPIDIVIEERMERQEYSGRTAEESRNRVLEIWCKRWSENRNGKGKWTRTLIKNLECWINREYGEMSYAMSQFLSGHGCFKYYLHKVKLSDSPKCLYGYSDADTVENTLLECNRWTAERKVLYEKLRALKIKISDLVPEMIRSPKNWNSVHTFMETLIDAKEKEARRSN
ncbi:uncharacterized protein LOC115886489 [Sitophilus oryzae]|uniref:Uncharacterized protein LOC115886489 n=1 Tax=Sitophilus oryzae TaxID=7048 RepID=A0A6J2YCC7_SITOR|nr:uncharacterized protein LOC115886489 [Sitophilus oryzae]